MSLDYRLVLVIGALLNSALYLTAIVAAGLVGGNEIAVRLAIATLGVNYLAYLAQWSRPDLRWLGTVNGLASIALGAAAGVALL